MRDQSDPQQVGENYLAMRELVPNGFGRDVHWITVGHAAQRAVMSAAPFDSKHVGPIEKYGRPDEIIVIREAQAPVMGRAPVRAEEL